MSEGQNAPDLRALDERYERLGELRGAEDGRTYLGKRRSDGADVMITVIRAANGGENNALSHLASDTQMLSRISHPNVPRVLDGLWIGKDAFAVVSERVRGTSLAELLSSGERFPFPRIAIVLQRVSAVLDWAREQGIVHRGVTADTLFFEQGTHRPVITLALTPIPLDGVPDAAADARTIGLLTWSMLTGKALAGDASEETLLELRPDLAKRVTADTVMMVRSKRGVAPIDVQDFLAVVATGDALKAADVEIARIQAELLEERRVERETIAAERVAEREQHEAEVRAAAERAAEIERRLADERVEFEKRKAEEEARLASNEHQLEAERLQFEQERLELEERNAELTATRGEVDRLKADEERRIAAAVAAAVAAAKAAMPVAPAYDEQLEYLPGEFNPSTGGFKQSESLAGEPQPWEAAASDVSVGRPRWMMPAIGAGVLVLLIATAVIVNYRSGGAMPGVVSVGKETVVPTPPNTEAGRVPRGGFMSQSAGGNVAPRVGPPLAPTDSTKSGAVAPALPKDSSASSLLSPEVRDSIAKQDSVARRERALIRERALKRAHVRDSLARDSLANRDTLSMRRDSTRIRPDTTTR